MVARWARTACSLALSITATILPHSSGVLVQVSIPWLTAAACRPHHPTHPHPSPTHPLQRQAAGAASSKPDMLRDLGAYLTLEKAQRSFGFGTSGSARSRPLCAALGKPWSSRLLPCPVHSLAWPGTA